MTRWPLVAALALSLAPLASPARKKAKVRAPVAPRVSAAARAAALRKVDAYLAQSAAGPIQQPGALVPFFERLYQLGGAAPESGAVHIIHFGDSHTAADEWTGGLRDQFQQRFGDGGSGFSLTGAPFLGYRRIDARGGATKGWQSQGLRSATGDGYFGLGGVSISTDRAGQSVYLDAECGALEVDYLRQPGGGRLSLTQDQEPLGEIATDGDLGPGFAVFQPAPGKHRFTLRTLDSLPVRLFGWVADRPSGVTYEALGINGAEAMVILKWNQAMLATYLQRRNPGLIVVAYGTNEASDPLWKTESYPDMFSTLLDRLRAAAPAASILVIGPTDRWARVKGKWQVYAGVDAIVNAERKVAREHGCAFWDGRRRMGGEGAMRDWVYAGLGQGDYVHFTAPGYHRLADALFSDL
ncbi:MAG TPA: SGNH/GDSL hydrolase family protein, partial [Bryobacteraceae bacterium]|nr:SGNH/GDSL hydrolase family protein [Bryobacteraceae bacterium]